MRYIYCTLYYYYISSTSDHQALDPRVWEPLQYSVLSGVLEKPTQPPNFFHYVILSEILSLERIPLDHEEPLGGNQYS